MTPLSRSLIRGLVVCVTATALCASAAAQRPVLRRYAASVLPVAQQAAPQQAQQLPRPGASAPALPPQNDDESSLPAPGGAIADAAGADAAGAEATWLPYCPPQRNFSGIYDCYINNYPSIYPFFGRYSLYGGWGYPYGYGGFYGGFASPYYGGYFPYGFRPYSYYYPWYGAGYGYFPYYAWNRGWFPGFGGYWGGAGFWNGAGYWGGMPWYGWGGYPGIGFAGFYPGYANYGGCYYW